jgi:hypothetical protein
VFKEFPFGPSSSVQASSVAPSLLHSPRVALASRSRAARAGQGATRASAGILAPIIEGHGSRLLRRSAAQHAMYDDFIARAPRRQRATTSSIKRNGTFELAFSDADVEPSASCRR